MKTNNAPIHKSFRDFLNILVREDHSLTLFQNLPLFFSQRKTKKPAVSNQKPHLPARKVAKERVKMIPKDSTSLKSIF